MQEEKKEKSEVEVITYLFKVEHTDKYSYYDFDSFVCSANSEVEARRMSPANEWGVTWSNDLKCWVDFKGRPDDDYAWVASSEIDHLKVIKLGVSTLLGENEILIKSFNAG